METTQTENKAHPFWKVSWNENQYDPLLREEGFSSKEEAEKFAETVWQPIISLSFVPLNLDAQYSSETTHF